ACFPGKIEHGTINWAYVDPAGTQHPFGVSYYYGICNTASNLKGYATDASGFYIDITNISTPIVKFPDGTKDVFPPSTTGPPILTDPNGNQLSSASPTGETDWYDTLGQIALKV